MGVGFVMKDIVYKKILVAIDGSKHSEKALAHAGAMARSFSAELHILYVSALSKQLPLPDQIKGSKTAQFSPSHPESYTKTVLTEALQSIPAGVKAITHDEPGEPRVVIVEFAEHNGCDMIVVGSRGLGTVSGLLMGSVSAFVVHRAKCPVLVIK